MQMHSTIRHKTDMNSVIEIIYQKTEGIFRVTRYDHGQAWPVGLFFDCKAKALQAAFAMVGFDPANIATI